MTDHYPRPGVLKSILHDRHAVIEASAGTGKTYAIEHMVIELLVRDGVPLEKILILTFTERAATELRRRIRSKIEEVFFDHCRESTCDHDKAGGVWWIDDQAKKRLSQALFSFDAASIGTIHGFFGRVLTEHAFDNGRLFKGTLEDGQTLFGSAFKQALRKSLARRPGEPAELLAIWLEQSGKGVDGLEALLYRCHASRREIRPPFSVDAARRAIDSSPLFEIDLEAEAERFQRALKGVKVHASTVKAIGTRLRILSGLLGGPNRTWQIMLDQRFQEAIQFIGDRVHGIALADDHAAQVAGAILRMQDQLVSLDTAMVQTCLPAVRAVLEAQKAATGQFDYDDLVMGVAQALDSPRGGELVSAMRARYQFALIDEFQDTDELQWTFFRRVFVESGARCIAHLIGDPKQAIYGFRGADVSTYLRARKYVEDTGTPRVQLASNFRSTAEMLEAYNHILDDSVGAPFFTGPIRYDVPVRAGRKLVAEEPGHIRAVPIHLLKIEPQGEKLEMRELRRGLVRQIAREARRVLSETEGLRVGPEGKTELIKPSDVFVLTATNNEALAISEALREADVPYAFYKQDGLFQTTEAQDIRDLLAAIDNPVDSRQRGRACLTPFFAVPLAELPDVAELPDSHPFIKRLLEWNELAGQRRFDRLFNRILDDSGIIRRELFLKDSERTLTNYLHLFEILLEHARTTGCELADLIATLHAYIQGTRQPPGEDGNIQRLETDRAAVQIMTIHKSKGLEAAVVFVYGGFTAFPSGNLYEYHDEGRRVLYIGDNPKAKEAARRERKLEEQRLYYVAMTRAKARLYLPLVPAEFWSDRWDGGYAQVNQRLVDVTTGLSGSGKEHLFQIAAFQDHLLGRGSDDPEDTKASQLTPWQPDPALLEERSYAGECAADRRRHAGYEVTSYSRMKSVSDSEGALIPLGREELDREVVEESTAAATAADGQLPGGIIAGLMLHEILEKIPFESPGNASTLDLWRALPQVAETITASLDHNNIDPAYRPGAEAMIYRALTCTLPTRPGRLISGLYQCPRILRDGVPLPDSREGAPAALRAQARKTRD